MPPRPNAPTLTRLCAVALLALAGIAAASDDSRKPRQPPESPEARLDLDAWRADWDRGLPAPRLDPARVKEILAALEQPKRPPSLWERFDQWLRSWFGDASERVDAPNWLAQLLQAIPAWVYKAIFWTLLGALVACLLVIVFIELRAAGVWRRRARAQAVADAIATATTGPAAPAPGLAGIAALPLREQPAALLQWGIRQLVVRRVLPADRSLTNGELLALVRARAPDELARFRRLTLAAEAVVYGRQEPDEAETRALLDALRALPDAGAPS